MLIMFFAAALRLYRLSDIPPGVNRDEASIGVTAYSLMKTGRDEYGRTYPLSFESFGDWKLPLYIYTTIPFIRTLGLSEMAIRLPSALAGIASVAAMYYLAYALFTSETIALVSALVLAIMPWHIHISRVESEAIVAVLFVMLGSLCFLAAVSKKSLAKLVASAVLFAGTYYTYHGTHVSTSLLIAGLTGIYWKNIVKIPRWWMAFAIGTCIALIIFAATITADHTKLSGISIFGDPTVVHTHIELPRLLHDNPDAWKTRLIHNRVTYAVSTIFQNYLKSYSTEFLFIQGGSNRAHNIQGYGNLHPMEAPLLLLGIAWLIAHFNKKSVHRLGAKESGFILWWIAIGAVAAAITKDAPHSNRMLMIVPALALAIAAGIAWILDMIPARWKKIAIVSLTICYLASMGYYTDQYFVHFPKNEAANWGYAYKKLTPVLFSQEYAAKQVVMTRPETSPYIYLLFYSGYSPETYQKEARRYPISNDGFTDVSGFGRFSFRKIDWGKDLAQRNTLLVSSPDEVPEALSQKIISTIKTPDSTIRFVVIDTDK